MSTPGTERPEPTPSPAGVTAIGEGRAMEAFSEPRSNEADHALVPLPAVGDEDRRSLARGKDRLGGGHRFGEHHLLDRLALDIEPFELGRDRLRRSLVIGREQHCAKAGIADPPPAFDPRPGA